ncbi:MAG: quinone-dependent dihydroorotate dehydrogenase [Chloroflexi bacterium]|nr:quinone-dependent dihydroorotate dehydrogenase [Chloroflexota bacterium]
MYRLIRPLLFQLDPETAHNLTLRLLRLSSQLPITNYLLHRLFTVDDPRLEIETFGIRFKNPLGLAAGYDKNGIAVKGLSALGFGHIEVGTITRLPQAGNPRPRVHRLVSSQAIINSMGFPNNGVESLKVERGAARVGVNIGKGKDTPLERASEDYCELLKRVHAVADYVTINVSSPNTLNLRQLQARAMLEDLLRAVTQTRNALTPRLPLLIKIAPDLSEGEIDDVIAAAESCELDGIIATNTTVSRDGMPPHAKNLIGGLSGVPLRARSTEVIRYLVAHTKLPVVGVGGITCAADALEKIGAGARLIQIYSGLIYSGPGLARQINQDILRKFH